MSYDNTNRGQIWKNDRKTEEKHADFTGNLNVNGVEYWINGWKRKDSYSKGAAALTFSIKPKEPAGNAHSYGSSPQQSQGSVSVPYQKQNANVQKTAESPSSPESMDDFDDDIPF
jgi:hypothetical protein